MRILGGILSVLLAFSGCSNYFESKFHAGVFEEKKIQITRKAEITKDNKTELIIFATYLNNLDYKFYKHLEYFFVEIYSPTNEPINLKRFQFKLEFFQGSKDLRQSQDWNAYITRDPQKPQKAMQLEPLYVRLISSSEYDMLFHPINKWSKCYLVAFPKYKAIDEDNIKMQIYVDDETQLLFDFSFKTISFELF